MKKTSASKKSKKLPRLEKVNFGMGGFYYIVYNSNLKAYIKSFKKYSWIN